MSLFFKLHPEARMRAGSVESFWFNTIQFWMCIDWLFPCRDFAKWIAQDSPCYLAKMLHLGSKDAFFQKYFPSTWLLNPKSELFKDQEHQLFSQEQHFTFLYAYIMSIIRFKFTIPSKNYSNMSWVSWKSLLTEYLQNQYLNPFGIFTLLSFALTKTKMHKLNMGSRCS